MVVRVNFGVPRIKYEDSKAHAAFAITKDVVDCGDSVLLVVSEKTVTFEFHRSGHIRAQPEVAVHVFVQRGDFMKAKTAASRVRPKSLITLGRVGKEFDQSGICREPESMFGGLEKLEHPFGGHACFLTTDVDND